MIEVKAKEDARTQLAENQIALAKASSLVSLVVTQVYHQKPKISSPPDIQKANLGSIFNKGLDKLANTSEDLGIVDPIATAAYTTEDLNSDGDTGRLIVEDALFVSESIGMDFRKKQHVILQNFSRKYKNIIMQNNTQKP
mmetsp:Transcript_65842/g.73464  ORF Transcript_65842/g.73464 Transcript_65842/m.73464 type:complete len:140 (-) Transcript_65842:169-588(-)